MLKTFAARVNVWKTKVKPSGVQATEKKQMSWGNSIDTTG